MSIAQQIMPLYTQPKIENNMNNMETERAVENNINYRKRKSFNYSSCRNGNRNKENNGNFFHCQLNEEEMNIRYLNNLMQRNQKQFCDKQNIGEASCRKYLRVEEENENEHETEHETENKNNVKMETGNKLTTRLENNVDFSFFNEMCWKSDIIEDLKDLNNFNQLCKKRKSTELNIIKNEEQNFHMIESTTNKGEKRNKINKNAILEIRDVQNSENENHIFSADVFMLNVALNFEKIAHAAALLLDIPDDNYLLKTHQNREITTECTGFDGDVRNIVVRDSAMINDLRQNENDGNFGRNYNNDRNDYDNNQNNNYNDNNNKNSRKNDDNNNYDIDFILLDENSNNSCVNNYNNNNFYDENSNQSIMNKNNYDNIDNSNHNNIDYNHNSNNNKNNNNDNNNNNYNNNNNNNNDNKNNNSDNNNNNIVNDTSSSNFKDGNNRRNNIVNNDNYHNNNNDFSINNNDHNNRTVANSEINYNHQNSDDAIHENNTEIVFLGDNITSEKNARKLIETNIPENSANEIISLQKNIYEIPSVHVDYGMVTKNNEFASDEDFNIYTEFENTQNYDNSNIGNSLAGNHGNDGRSVSLASEIAKPSNAAIRNRNSETIIEILEIDQEKTKEKENEKQYEKDSNLTYDFLSQYGTAVVVKPTGATIRNAVDMDDSEILFTLVLTLHTTVLPIPSLLSALVFFFFNLHFSLLFSSLLLSSFSSLPSPLFLLLSSFLLSSFLLSSFLLSSLLLSLPFSSPFFSFATTQLHYLPSNFLTVHHFYFEPFLFPNHFPLLTIFIFYFLTPFLHLFLFSTFYFLFSILYPQVE
jgi:hypothetical protein